MKKIYVFLVLLSVIANSYATGPLDDVKKGGALSYLTFIKTNAEFTITKTASPKAEVVLMYNNLVGLVNGLVNQLNAEMIVKNNVKPFKEFNSFLIFGSSSGINSNRYETSIRKIDEAFLSLLDSNPNLIEDIFKIIEFGEKISTDIRKNKSKKVESITKRFDSVKLLSVPELVKADTKPKDTSK